MTDLEITRLCAAAMGWKHKVADGVVFTQRNVTPKSDWNDYSPLYSDAQAMALDGVILADNHGYWMNSATFVRYEDPGGSNVFEFHGDMTEPKNRRRARCECVAKMQNAKTLR